MEYNVKIDAFEGPLDLLLYLIKETKISIDNINVSHITEQYIDYIHTMERFNLEIASEYLVMAAHLIYIKSKMMLPKANLDDDNLEYEENPEEKLKLRLKIYKLFKDMIPFLQELEDERSNYLTKLPTDFSNDYKMDTKDMLLQEGSIYDLISAYNKAIRRYLMRRPLKTRIQHQTISIDERISQLKLILRNKPRINFIELYSDNNSKEIVVVTFMAVLELAKVRLVKITQEDLFDDIFIEYKIENDMERSEIDE